MHATQLSVHRSCRLHSCRRCVAVRAEQKRKASDRDGHRKVGDRFSVPSSLVKPTFPTQDTEVRSPTVQITNNVLRAQFPIRPAFCCEIERAGADSAFAVRSAVVSPVHSGTSGLLVVEALRLSMCVCVCRHPQLWRPQARHRQCTLSEFAQASREERLWMTSIVECKSA